jgi:hypothetical protein
VCAYKSDREIIECVISLFKTDVWERCWEKVTVKDTNT